MKALRVTLLALSALSGTSFAANSDTPRPWLKGIASSHQLAGIHTIRAKADVEVSDGKGFSTTVVYHDPQRAVFRSQDADHTVTMGIEGKYVWTFDGSAETEADPLVRDFVLGHQFHAQILFYDRLYPDHEKPRQTTLEDRPCSVVTAGDENTLRSLYYDPAGRPLGMRMHHGPEMRIAIKFGDLREVGGVSLPFLVWIDDGKAQFEYHYTEVRLNEGSLAEFRAPLDRLTDEQALLRLHRVFMDDRLFGRSSGMKEGLAESVVIVSRGEVLPLSGEETLQTLKGVLARTDYTRYDDLIRPVVRVSKDGALGWVIVQVAAAGVRLDEEGKPAGPLVVRQRLGRILREGRRFMADER